MDSHLVEGHPEVRMSTIALALACLPASAGSNTTDWTAIDAELAALGRQIEEPSRSGPTWSGFLRASFAQSSEPVIDSDGDDVADQEFAGFSFENVRVGVDGVVGEFTWGVSFDFGGIGLQDNLIDAWIGRRAWEGATAYLGLLRAPLLRTQLLPETTNLFVVRTRNAYLLTPREAGVRIDQALGDARLSYAVQNGANSIAEDLRLSVRGEWDVLGRPTPDAEGAYGAPAELAATVGLALTNDDSLDGGGLAVLADAALVSFPWSLQFEVVDYDDGYTSPIFYPDDLEGDSTPWSLTASWVFLEHWEAAVRYEDYDEAIKQREALSLGVNRYVAGHDLKWQLNYIDIDGEAGSDNEFIVLGSTLAF